MSKAQAVTNDDFQKEVLEASKKIPIVVDFWASWCGPCMAMGPIFDEIAEEMTDKAKFVKVNVDEETELRNQYGVMSIPTLIYFKDGKPSNQTVGLIGKNDIVEQLEKLI